ncbi:MAG: outer membrane lipoprotein-sorting protein [Planctomycetota bacterium]|nr:MAG: outer membrane lipoprotein-sorting protein [Planctomycetota bacterium]
MKRAQVWSLVGALALLGSSQAQDLDGEQIVRKAEEMHRARDERGVVDLVLVTASGKRERRSMETFFKQGEGEDDMTLLRFLSPPKVRGTSLLTREATGRPDDQWIYLPAFKKSKKIASNKRTNRFAGTDFTFEDLRTEDYSGNTYRRLDDRTVKLPDGPTECFVVEATPKNPDLSGYSRRLIYVEKKRFLIVRVEFFDKKGRHQKTLTARGFEKVGGLWRAKRSMMEDHLRGSKTVMQFSERTINPGLSDSLFTKQSLERGL